MINVEKWLVNQATFFCDTASAESSFGTIDLLIHEIRLRTHALPLCLKNQLLMVDDCSPDEEQVEGFAVGLDAVSYRRTPPSAGRYQRHTLL